MRIHELAGELDLDCDGFIRDINAANLGFKIDNRMSRVTHHEVAQIKEALGFISHRLIGAWKLLRLTRRGGDVITGQRHLVIRDHKLWEVWPKQTRHEGDPDPWTSYELTWPHSDTPGHLVIHAADFERHYLVKFVGDELYMRAGGLAGHPPKSFADEAGTLAVFVRETDPEVLATLQAPPPPVPQRHLEHPVFGRLAYDENLDWWTSKITWDGEQIAFHSDGRPNAGPHDFDDQAEALALLDIGDLKQAAAEELLDTHNASWCDPGEEIDAATFVSRMALRSITIEAGGLISVYFDDGELFWGHSIFVTYEGEVVTDAGIAG